MRSLYIALTFTMRHSLICLFVLLVLPIWCQEKKERAYQLEFSAGAFGIRPPAKSNWFYHLGAGINLPARKTGWYTNVAFNFTWQRRITGNSLNYYSLTVGKHRQWTHGHFHASLGFNAGLYFLHEESDNWFNTGIAVSPRAEIGRAFKEFKLSFGIYFSMGAGYWHDPDYMEYYGDSYWSWSHGYWFRMNGALCPYLKIIL
jgi:hypothetical protein